MKSDTLHKLLPNPLSATDRRESRLLIPAALFLFLYALVLTLSPAVRERSWDVSYRLSHWLGFLLWLLFIFFAHRIAARKLPDRDPFLLPLASLLSGWGLMTIWRLDSSFGMRQVLWLGISIVVFAAILFTPKNLHFLRQYKYVLLAAGLGLTALTLLLGTNPTGVGPRLWLGCCGVYLQPSEPLKLLLVVYLSAYLADRPPVRQKVFPLILPTIFVTGLALLLLIVQRDLGTASIFILLYTVMLYLVTDKRRVLLVTAGALVLAGLTGFFFVNVIHARLEAWLNPWNDPSGRSYQIIQSLLAVANGGTFGRGPGLGSPSLVPVSQSDFIFSAIAEETGLTGTIAMFVIFGLILARGLVIALRARDRFRRFLAAGLTAYIGIQAMLIIGGNIRLLPLTGVTLPFVSYGGSSLLTSFIALALLMLIGAQNEVRPAPITSPRPYFLMAGLLALGLLAASLVDTWWAVVRAPDLLTRTDNPRRSIADRYVLRGQLLDRENQPIDSTEGKSSAYKRVYLYPDLAPVTGYIHPTYGQAGLEASLDDYLRGLQGNPSSLLWWDQLLYGTPPPGLDVRLSLDLNLQKKTDQLMEEYKGAVVLINAQSGEILVMSSHPTYDPGQLDKLGPSLAQDTNTPLLNRAAQGLYPVGNAIAPFRNTLGPNSEITDQELQNLYEKLGFYAGPKLRMPVASVRKGNSLQVSPLQMALAAATLSGAGVRPAPRIAIAVDTPQQGWVILHPQEKPTQVFSAETAKEAALSLSDANQPYWEWNSSPSSQDKPISWYLAGTVPNWQATPLSIVVLLEGNHQAEAKRIGEEVIQTAIQP